MIKVKDGYAKLIGTTYNGSADRVLLSNGGDKAVSDFAAVSDLSNYVTLATAQTITGVKTFARNTFILAGREQSDIKHATQYAYNWGGYGRPNTTPIDTGMYNSLDFYWYDAIWSIGSLRSGSTVTNGFGIGLKKTDNDGNLYFAPAFRITETESYINNNKIWHVGNLTKISQLTNDTGYLTSTSLNNYVTLDTAQTITGAKTFANTIVINNGYSIADESNNGVLGVKPTAWTGVPSNGTAISLGTTNNSLYFRSSGDNMYHYNYSRGVSYKILDAFNYSSYALPLSGGTMSGDIKLPKGYFIRESTVLSYAIFGVNADNLLHVGSVSYILNLRGNGDALYNNNTLLHSGNYNSYSPTLTGGGASGTWNITANNANKLGNISSSGYLKHVRYLKTEASADDFFTTLKEYTPVGLIGVQSNKWANIISNKKLDWGYGLIYTQNEYKTSSNGVNMGGLYIPQSGGSLYVLSSIGGSTTTEVTVKAFSVITESNIQNYLPKITDYYWADVPISSSPLTNTNPTFGSLIVDGLIRSKSGIIRPSNPSANAISAITFYKGSSNSTEFKRDAVIGWFNEGGTNKNGALYLVPYPQDTEPWTASVGLFISQTHLIFEGKTVYHSGNLTSLKNPNALTAFGVVYDGSSAKTINEQTLIDRLLGGTVDCTDDTIMLTSHSNGWSGNAGVVYGRPASKMYNYIKGKLDLVYLPLSGGTLKGTLSFNDTADARISPMIKFGSYNQDTILWKVYSSDQTYSDKSSYGFDMTYTGTGGGDDNKLILHADNQNAATKVAAMTVTNAGVVSFAKNITAAGFIKSGSSDSYVLLGGGGHKALSTLQSDYDSRYVNTTGDTMAGSLYIVDGAGIYDNNVSKGILAGLSSSNTWDGVSGYACTVLGSISNPTVIRTSGDNLQHYNASQGARYKIWDAYNSNNYSNTWKASTLYIGADDKYIGTDSGQKYIWVYVGGTYMLSCTKDEKCVRRGQSASDISLGSSTYPWNGIYSTIGNFSGGITLTGTTADTAQLRFSRSGASTWNYIIWPGNTDSDCKLAFASGSSSSESFYYMTKDSLYPVVNNTNTLGTSSFKWNNVYSTTFTGYLNGTAAYVSCPETSSNYDRPLVGTPPATNQLYYTSKATVNWSTGNITSGGLITSGKLIATSGGPGSTSISYANAAIMIGTVNRTGTASEYYPGIAFNHMYTYGGGTGYRNHAHAWIGLKLHSTPNAELSYLVFATNGDSTTGTSPIERMSIAPDGTVNILKHMMLSSTSQIYRTGTSTSWYLGRSNALLKINSYSGYNAITSMKTTNGDWSMGVYANDIMYFTYITDSYFNAGNNTVTAQIYFAPSGGVYATAFYQHSDLKLKENIKAILNSENTPQIKEFDWKSNGSHSYGLIAQELEEQGYSELVSNEGDGTKTVNYSAALSLIVGKLQVKIKELEKEIENLKKSKND